MKGFVTRKSNSKKWYVVVDTYDDNGKRHQKWFAGYRTKKEAEQALLEKLREVEMGVHKPGAKETVGSFMLKWLEGKQSSIRYYTLRKYNSLINQHIVPRLGHIELEKLKPDQVQKCYSQMLKDGIGPRYVLHAHRLLHQAFDRAVQWGLMVRNVTDAVEPPRAQKYRGQIWTPEEALRFWDYTHQHERLYWIVFVYAIMTGMRQGEILGAKWSDINWENGTQSISREMNYIRGEAVFQDVKTSDSSRLIKLFPEHLNALREHRAWQAEQRLFLGSLYQDHDMVAASADGRPMSQNALNKAWYRSMDRSGIRRIRFHDLRHTHASLLLARGIPIKVIQERLGHSSITVTSDLYSHLTPGLQEYAAEQFSDMLQETRRALKK